MTTKQVSEPPDARKTSPQCLLLAPSTLSSNLSLLTWIPPPSPLRAAQMIKEHSMDVQQDKMRARMEHEEMLQAEMEERMLLEERRRNAADRLIADMEEAEEIAIERLRRTQEEQKKAYEELERALSNPPPRIEDRQAALGVMYEADDGAQPPFS